VYHDYFDADGLRNPYAPAAETDDRLSQRQRLILLGMIGAGLSVVTPIAARDPGPTADQAVVLDLPADPLFG
jgi:hypothetical protein